MHETILVSSMLIMVAGKGMTGMQAACLCLYSVPDRTMIFC